MRLVRSVMLYGGETRALTRRLTSILLGCDRKMLRNMAGVTWRDHVSSLEVAGSCAVRELGAVLRGRRLGWFGHVERRDETKVLGKTQLIEVPGCQPPGRPQKTWRKNMQEELARRASSEQRSMVDCHQPSHLMKMSSKDIKRKIFKISKGEMKLIL